MADLTIGFNKINLPETNRFGDTGKVQVEINNVGTEIAEGPITVNLWSSTDSDIDGNDIVLFNETVNAMIKPGQKKIVNINDYVNNTSAIAPGAYHLIAEVEANAPIVDQDLSNNVVSELVSGTNTNVVIDWNATALNALQAEGKAGRSVDPTSGSRSFALLSTAVYNAVNAFEQTYTSYGFDVDAPVGGSIEAAAVGAAHQILSVEFPEQIGVFDQQLAKSLTEISDSAEAEAIGVDFGRSVADSILALRANDGSDNNTPYEAPEGDYVWEPDAPNFTVVSPNWGQVTPWGITSVADFAAPGLDGLPDTNPDLYIQEIEEIRLVGGREDTAVTQIQRTADQTEFSIFWAYDRADTFRPFGQLNQIAQEVAVNEQTPLVETARVFAALNVGLADAAIVAWDAKYDYVQPRPDDVIAEGFAANDGYDETVHDPDWRPLLDSPAFPDYISGHTTFAGAFAGVLTEFYGDNYQFDAVSQELPGVIRSFDSFLDAATEDGESRIYGGIHVREATVTDALPVGFEVGSFVATNLFQPTDTAIIA